MNSVSVIPEHNTKWIIMKSQQANPSWWVYEKIYQNMSKQVWIGPEKINGWGLTRAHLLLLSFCLAIHDVAKGHPIEKLSWYLNLMIAYLITEKKAVNQLYKKGQNIVVRK